MTQKNVNNSDNAGMQSMLNTTNLTIDFPHRCL